MQTVNTSSNNILCEVVYNGPMFAANEEIKLVLNWKTSGSIKWYEEVSETRALRYSRSDSVFRKCKHKCTMQPLFHP